MGVFLQRAGLLGSAAAGFDPATLFAAGETGDYWINDPAYYYTDTAATTLVTGTGDAVAAFKGAENGTLWTQDTAAARLIYREDAGGKAYLEGDRVDDWMRAPIGFDLNGATWDFGMSYVPDATDFILLTKDGAANPWVGIGQDGSTSTSLAGTNATQNAFYVDDALSSETTRGGQYDLVQAGNRVLVNFAITAQMRPRFGKYDAGSFFAPGPIYRMILREGTMDADQRADWDAYAAEGVGV